MSFQIPQWQKDILQIVTRFLPPSPEAYTASSASTVENLIAAVQTALADPTKFQGKPAGLDVVASRKS